FFHAHFTRSDANPKTLHPLTIAGYAPVPVCNFYPRVQSFNRSYGFCKRVLFDSYLRTCNINKKSFFQTICNSVILNKALADSQLHINCRNCLLDSALTTDTIINNY
ncbi:unnamed protein product, partial [Owenia fusiformis]